MWPVATILDSADLVIHNSIDEWTLASGMFSQMLPCDAMNLLRKSAGSLDEAWLCLYSARQGSMILVFNLELIPWDFPKSCSFNIETNIKPSKDQQKEQEIIKWKVKSSHVNAKAVSWGLLLEKRKVPGLDTFPGPSVMLSAPWCHLIPGYKTKIQ